VAIFYMDVKIIGRSSGRSAVGASAYRSGEKLRSNAIKSAAYGSGSKLRNGEIVHDYTKKKGVMHSEIILPDNAPEKYRDRETLWNAVEISEKRKDAQLAREIIFALPREFDLSEHIEVTRQYVKENFVANGMIADFAIHDTGEGNPHAHIMLTTRNVSPEGFGLKNTDWNKKENLLSWRKAWTHIINSTLENKGIAERIDHRSYKEQGIDQEPTIHLGHKAAALEHQGIRTERGNYNREITRRNEERTTLKEAIHMEFQKIEKLAEKLERIINLAEGGSETVPNELITKLKTANRMNEAQQENPTTPNKPRYVMANQDFIENPSIIKKGKRSIQTRQIQMTLNKEHRTLQTEYDEANQELKRLDFLAENIDENAKNIQTLNKQLSQMQAEHQKLRPILDRKRKKDLEKEIEHVEGELRAALYYFEHNYHIAPSEASSEIARILNQKQAIESALKPKFSRILTLENKLNSIKYARNNDNERKIKRKTEPQPPEQRNTNQLQPTQTHGIEHRRSVPKVMRELRKEADEETKRRRRRKALAKAKPRQMYEVKPLPQKRLHRDEYYIRKTKKNEHYR